MFTEIRISGIVQWPFSGHSVPLNAAEWQAQFSDHSIIFFYFQGKKVKFFLHQIRSFKVILLWITTQEINKKWGKNQAHRQGRSRVFFASRGQKYATILLTYLKMLWPWRNRLEHLAHKRNVGCPNPSCERIKLLKQVVTAPLPNARQ